jgi:hypothetical protein
MFDRSISAEPFQATPVIGDPALERQLRPLSYNDLDDPP